MISIPAFATLFNRLVMNCTMPSQVWKGSGDPPVGFVSAEDFMNEFYQLFKDRDEEEVRGTIDEWLRTSEDRFFPYPRELRRLWATMYGGLTQASKERQEREEIDRQNKSQEARYQRIKAEVEAWPEEMRVEHGNRAEDLYVENVSSFVRESEAEINIFSLIGKKIYFIKAYEAMKGGKAWA